MIPTVGYKSVSGLYAGPNMKYLYNQIKDRVETWEKFPGTDPLTGHNYLWTIRDADPATVFKERFFNAGLTTSFEDIVLCEHPWERNGNRQDNLGVPNAYNFSPGGMRPGGGLRILSGDTADDWVAMHATTESAAPSDGYPKWKLTGTIWTRTELFGVLGLIGDGNVEWGNANPWTTPDDGIWMEFAQTGAADLTWNFITSKDGVQEVTDCGVVPHDFQINMEMGDNSYETRIVINGHLHGTHSTYIPWNDFRPLFMIQTREDDDKTMRLYELCLIQDLWRAI